MLSAPILKGLTSFLSSLDAISAVYDTDFNLVSTDSEDFFSDLDVSTIASDPPQRGETAYTVMVNGEKMILSVTPVFKSKRIIAAYIFVARSDYQLYKQMCAGSIPDYFSIIMDRIREDIAACSQMNDLLQNTGSPKKNAALLQEQNRILKGLYADLGKTRSSIFSTAKVDDRINCNVSALLNCLCNDTLDCLKDVKRKVNIDIDTRNCYCNIDHELFTAAFSNALMYHLQCSPLKSAVNIKSTIYAESYAENYFELTVKTKALPEEDETTENDAASAKYCRDLAHKIICYDFGGEYEIDNSDGYVTTMIKLPVLKKNRGKQLNSNNSPYLGADYKPMYGNLSHMITVESAELKKQKGSKNSASKKA